MADQAKPPLGLAVEVEDADGRRWRWSGDERSSQDIPRNLSFRTQRGDGFADASLTLTRRIDRDYPDLNLLDTIRLIGHDGSVAYEGRLTGNPRSLDDAGHSISVETIGWMTHARDRTFREIYVDRNLGAWQPMSRDLRIAIIGGGAYAPSDPAVATDNTSGLPSVRIEFDGEWTTASLPNGIAVYDCGSGLTGSALYYDWSSSSNSANWAVRFASATGDDATSFNAGEFSADIQSGVFAAPGTFTPTTARRYLFIQAYFAVSASNSQPNFKIDNDFRRIAVFGSHGLTKRGTAPSQGYYASDVIENIANRFCPRLDTTNVEDTTYTIGQIAYKSATDPYDAFLDLNSFHDWELNVWEDRKLYFNQPTSLDDYDWEVRLDDEGTRVQLEGDSVERLANGVVVTYTDLILGTTQTITPDDNSALSDTTESNPANRHGIDKWIQVEVPFPTLSADAVQWGTAALAQFNTPSSPGRITVRGHIRDRQGNWQQGWKPKAGERITISNHPNDRARRITGTTWNHDMRTLEIEVEQDQRRLEVIAAHIDRARGAAGLS